MDDVSRVLEFASADAAKTLFGERNESLERLEQLAGVKIHARGQEVRIDGAEPDVELAGRVLRELFDLIQSGHPIFADDMQHAYAILAGNERAHLKDVFLDTIYVAADKRRVAPRSLNQKRYIDAMREKDLVLGIGPAGTGKTYLAMAMAVAALKRHQVRRIVLTRPAVEAGEKLGFLPGDLAEKVNPYLRPLYDALHDMMEFEQASKLAARGTIEVAPLAFMRGRTLSEAFVILDEAQNTTTEQMKMFLTRLGVGSRAVVTGDVTQIDLPAATRSGLLDALEILDGVEGIGFSYFGPEDVVRHRLVRHIVDAYDRHRGHGAGRHGEMHAGAGARPASHGSPRRS
jgi:phosphate starvation-inducible PhoH-like protein